MIRIVLIGAGNVATHLGTALKIAGNEIIQVYSRTEKSASDLAKKLASKFTANLSEISPNADLYIISVSDDIVGLLLSQLNIGNKLIVHTSGFLSMDILDHFSENVGVLYPLQTFSKSQEVDMKKVPVCIEANTLENLNRIKSIAEQISYDVREVSSEQRMKIHIAAVFACNFPNFMYTIANNLLSDARLDFDILKPLILETARKVQDINPVDAQTGPAKRGDQKVITSHMELLKDYPAYRELYQIITDQINNSIK